jgi:hypothetical protein
MSEPPSELRLLFETDEFVGMSLFVLTSVPSTISERSVTTEVTSSIQTDLVHEANANATKNRSVM